MHNFNLSKQVQTRINLRGLDARGKEIWASHGHNTFTYAASDILTSGAIVSGGPVVSRLYVRFSNNLAATPLGGDGILTSTTAGLITTARSNFLDTLNPNCGGFWVNALSSQLAPSDANYNSNQATLFFRVSANAVSQSGAAFSPGTSGSYIAALGLAAPFDPNDPTKDRIFSAMNYTTFVTLAPFYVPTGGQVAIDYYFLLNS